MGIFVMFLSFTVQGIYSTVKEILEYPVVTTNNVTFKSEVQIYGA